MALLAHDVGVHVAGEVGGIGEAFELVAGEVDWYARVPVGAFDVKLGGRGTSSQTFLTPLAVLCVMATDKWYVARTPSQGGFMSERYALYALPAMRD